jgi:hypothetical protein
MSKTVYIPSTSNDPKLTAEGTPVWGISIIKSRGEVIAVASEGTEKHGDTFTSFTFDVFGCRRVEVRSGAARMTQKVKDQLLAGMRLKLINEGLAPSGVTATAA